MGSMWPWGALGSVGNAQRAVAPPWGPRLPGHLPPGCTGTAQMVAELSVRPDEAAGPWEGACVLGVAGV